VALEAIASSDLWIWNAFIEMALINVLDRPPFLRKLLVGEFLPVEWRIQDRLRLYPCLLADGIYPPFSFLVQSFMETADPKKKFFSWKNGRDLGLDADNMVEHLKQKANMFSLRRTIRIISDHGKGIAIASNSMVRGTTTLFCSDLSPWNTCDGDIDLIPKCLVRIREDEHEEGRDGNDE